MSGLKIGDLVKLKSGSPVMTVDSVDDRGQCGCKWFLGDEKKSAVFSQESLVRTNPDADK